MDILRSVSIRRTMAIWLSVCISLFALVSCDHDPEVSFPETEDVGDDDGGVSFPDGDSADEPEEAPAETITLTAAVARIVQDLSTVCASMQSDAAVIARDVADGLVDYQAEWHAVEDAREEFEDSVVEVNAWVSGLQVAIRQDDGDVQAAINDLPYDASEPVVATSTYDRLHRELSNGSLEPSGHDFSALPPPSDSPSVGGSSSAALSVRVATFLVTHAGDLIEAAGALVEEIEDGIERYAERRREFRKRLAAELDAVACDLDWPIDTAPTGLWTTGSCAREQNPHSVVGPRVTEDRSPARFSIAAPASGTVTGVVGRGGALVDAIGIVYDSSGQRVTAGPEGGAGGQLSSFDIPPGDAVRSVTIWHDKFINAVEIRTSSRSHMFGSPSATNASPNPTSTTFTVEDGTEFVGLVGQYAEFRPGQQAFALNKVGCVSRRG